MKRVKCISGIEGWQDKLQKVYANFDEFKTYDEIFNNAKRLGFATAKQAWDANPLIQGSLNPTDYRSVEIIKEAKRIQKAYIKQTKQHFDFTDFLDQLAFNENGEIITI